MGYKVPGQFVLQCEKEGEEGRKDGGALSRVTVPVSKKFPVLEC